MQRLLTLLPTLLITLLCGCTANNPGQTSPSISSSEISTDTSQSFVTWLDNEYTQSLDFSPLAKTRLGLKEDYGELDDVSETGLDKRLSWRKDSVTRMQANFDRDQLSAEDQLRGTYGFIYLKSPKETAPIDATDTSSDAMAPNPA